ncbi:hypothetical protein, partial [Kitasatospora aureofaciens]
TTHTRPDQVINASRAAGEAHARTQRRSPARQPHVGPSSPVLTPRHRNPLVITTDQRPSQLVLPFDTDPQPAQAVVTVVPGTVIQPTTTASTGPTTSATHPKRRPWWRRLWSWTTPLFHHN